MWLSMVSEAVDLLGVVLGAAGGAYYAAQAAVRREVASIADARITARVLPSALRPVVIAPNAE